MAPSLSLPQLHIAVVGATGAVGEVALQLLAARGVPPEQVRALASPRSAGRKLPYGDASLTVQALRPAALAGCDAAFVSATAEVSRQVVTSAPPGLLVIDDSAEFRMDPQVPLVVPAVNGATVRRHRGVIAIPNCTTTPLVLVLAALAAAREVRAVTVSTYQSASGAGRGALRELRDQTRALLDGAEAKARELPGVLGFNLLPEIGALGEDGYSREEAKIHAETRKILGREDLRISATAVRVPVEVSHSEVVHVELDRPLAVAEAEALLDAHPGIRVRPRATPREAAGADEVLVSRLRLDRARPAGLVLWLSCDNLRLGAALNALHILDECLRRDCLRGARNAAP